MDITVGTIPESVFYDYRVDVMFDSYKWDLQAGEQSTISDKVILLDKDSVDFITGSAVSLYHETVAMEQALRNRPDLVLKLGISEKMTHALCSCSYRPEEHIRLMRFDFHPTKATPIVSGNIKTENREHSITWKISEVNSDVPAGYPEASVLPRLAARYFENYSQHGNFGDVLASRFAKLAPHSSTIAFLHDTHTVEDCQIMHFMGDLLEQYGYNSLYMDPSHLKQENIKASNIGAIMRYYPVEWLEYKKGVDWLSLVNAHVPSCNHPVALLAQSKRLPLVWDELGGANHFWKRLLPETVCATTLAPTDGWILKPAFGRVGEGINIPGAVSDEENKDIKAAACAHPTQWVAQKMFESLPVDGLHLSLGVFVVDGQFAGLFGRTSAIPRMDAQASEVPVLVKKEVSL